MERTTRYTLRPTKVRVEKLKKKQSRMKDLSDFDIEYQFLEDNINQLRQSTLNEKLSNLERDLKSEQQKFKNLQVLESISNLRAAIAKSRRVFDHELNFLKSEKRRLEREKKQYESCKLCGFETRDKNKLLNHKSNHSKKRKMPQEKSYSKRQKVLEERVLQMFFECRYISQNGFDP